MRAADMMTKNVVSVSPETPASRAVSLCLTNGVGGVSVVDRDRRVVGMIGQDNLVRGSEGSAERRALWLHFLAEGMARREQLAEEGDLTADRMMTPDVVSTTEEAPIEEVARLLVEHDIERLPVVHDGRLVGMIGRWDVLGGFPRMAEMKRERTARATP